MGPKINLELAYYAIYLYLRFWKPQMVYPFKQVQSKELSKVVQVYKLTTQEVIF